MMAYSSSGQVLVCDEHGERFLPVVKLACLEFTHVLGTVYRLTVELPKSDPADVGQATSKYAGWRFVRGGLYLDRLWFAYDADRRTVSAAIYEDSIDWCPLYDSVDSIQYPGVEHCLRT